ncbi:ADP-ribosylglycohydrolase family protein [Ktedonospora formicarum]|uniref:ADP-ribosylglycohydrolase family protein n=1 Tax=Ktedonospora formicarum TaxID=2778364 RepID=A0A8J3HR88_9CHLR|nr:ADP-ribosylglycohydrolase family protein [Ktedonospora formicarum]GHO42377.1 hypothetical protein KSX_05400 [Ktedonospora formicarum]
MSAYSFPEDYVERVYAGVLGKLIGVYLGRPFEGWTYERIMSELGEIRDYVHEKLGVPLVVTDDDLTGTFTFLRALPDYGNTLDLTPAQIGQTWLNYIIEQRTILWWGGMGNSTEHTAYLRLKAGIPAPQSGSIALNGQIVAEQIGAQIFIDGWGMVSPSNPVQAAELAWRAGSVSHDGEAVYAAQVIAAMEAAAFVESDMQKLLDVGLSVIPSDSLVARLIEDIRAWHREEPDWRVTRERIVERYGYERYGGNCHVIPNHALIILALLYGEDDVHKSLMIVNTCGWDTDCNSGNVGCLLGIKNGLRGLEGGPDWRGPIADRLYMPTADGGRAITDAVNEAYHVVSIGYALAGQSFAQPKDGARFHFSFPGSVQGFQVDEQDGSVVLQNESHPTIEGQRCLAIAYRGVSQPTLVGTPTFIPPSARQMPDYGLYASPTLYAGQLLTARLIADSKNATSVSVRTFVHIYNDENNLDTILGPASLFRAGEEQTCAWRIPDTQGAPIVEVGFALDVEPGQEGRLYLDSLGWDGVPDTTLTGTRGNSEMRLRAWVNAVDQFEGFWPESFRLIQNAGRGMVSQGGREWQDYRVSATIKPHLARAFGIAARVQGLRRYYALLLTNTGQVQLLKVLDGEQVLSEAAHVWELEKSYQFSLQVVGDRIQAFIDSELIFDVLDENSPLNGGGIALVCEEGHIGCDVVRIQPAS